jgi:hypothetical protein
LEDQIMASKNTKVVAKAAAKNKADAIRATFAKVDNESAMVWVATRKNPTKSLGYVDGITGDTVFVGIEAVGHVERKIETLVLYSQPKTGKVVHKTAEKMRAQQKPAKAPKVSRAEQNMENVKAFAFPTRKSMKALAKASNGAAKYVEEKSP